MTKDGRHIEEGADILDEDTLIKNIQDDYEYSFREAKTYLDIAIAMKLEHDNAIDPRKLPTRSKISIPHKFAQVEEALSKAHEYLWPPSNPVLAVPSGENASIEDARKVSEGLYRMAKDRMGCQVESLPTERDCVKVGFGYAIVEPCKFQQLEPFVIDIEDGKSHNTTTEMDIGDPISSLRQRYITPGQIIPYPDGWTTNGPSRASTIFFWDFETEHNFRNLCSDENLEGLDFDTAKLNDAQIDEVIAKAKEGAADFVGETFSYIAKLGGIDYTKLTNAADGASATIPILKVYREGEHIWLANGVTIIYRQASKAQTYRCPILKMCAVRDAQHWYPYTASEALMDVNYNRNVWLNMITDIMTWSANRPLIYSSSSFDEAPSFGPGSAPIPVDAPDARTGAAFLSPPSLANGDLQLGQILDERASEVSGEKDFTQKNFSRGGQNAFNDLLNSSRGRERIAGAVMESGFMTDLFTQILIYMQIDGLGYTGNVVEFDERDGEEKISRVDVSGSDMKQTFTIMISLDAKRTATEFSPSERLQIGQVLRQDPAARPYEAWRFILGNDELTHQMIKSQDEAEAIQQEDRDDQRAATQAGIKSAQGAQPVASPELAGAELGGAPGV